MRLLIILALLLLNGDAGELLKEAEPVLKDIGGEDLQKALKEAEELSDMLSAVKSAGEIFGGTQNKTQKEAEREDYGFPLAPIAAIADKNITYRMAKYLSEEG